MTIRNKILLLVSASIIIVVGVTLGMAYMQAKEALTNAFIVNATAQAERMKDFTTKFLDDGRLTIDFLSKQPSLRNSLGKLQKYTENKQEFVLQYDQLNAAEKEIYQIFSYYTATNPAYAIIYLGSADAGFMQQPDDSISPNYDPRQRSWYTQPLRNPNQVFLSESYLSINKETVYTIAKAIQDNQTTVGVVALDINIGMLSRFFEKIKIGDTGHALIIEGNGTIISNSDDPTTIGKKLSEVNASELEKAFEKGEGAYVLPIRGEMHLAYITTTPENWRFIILMDQEEAIGSALKSVQSSLMVGGGCALLMVILSLFIVHSIIAPINRLVSVAEAVAGGNLDAVDRTTKYSGELKSLYNSIVHMVDNLAKLITTANEKTEEAGVALENGNKALMEAEAARQEALQAKSQGMRSAASSLTTIVTQIKQAAEDLAEEINYSENGTTEQAARMSQTSISMEQMNSTVMDVAKNASRAAYVTTQAKEKAKNGAQSMQEVVTEITNIETDAQALTEDMTVLESHAQSISAIMNVISDIADQTNLLALNAAIEAARAGDAGRGFAVVADEVRKLAEKTMISTTDVGSAIKAIQQSVSKSRNQVDKAVKGISQAADKAKISGESLDEIQNMVDQAQAEVQAIATASEEQSATSEEITRDVTMVNSIAGNTAQAMQKSGSIIKDLTNQAQVLDRLIEDLKKA